MSLLFSYLRNLYFLAFKTSLRIQFNELMLMSECLVPVLSERLSAVLGRPGRDEQGESTGGCPQQPRDTAGHRLASQEHSSPLLPTG